MLTKRQKEVLDFIEKYKSKKEYSPSLEEIRRRFRLASVSTAYFHVKKLEDLGYLDREKNKPRGINVYKKELMVKVPILGTIAAGQPIEAIENREETIAISKNKLPKTGKVYALRVIGNSMIDENIDDGDVILVKQQSVAENGQKVVALIDNSEATLKKFYKERGRIKLQPANKEMEPIIIKKNRELNIQGVVIDVIKNEKEPSKRVKESDNLKKRQKELAEKMIKNYWNNQKLDKTNHLIVIGDSRNMKKIKDNAVHLIVTSPPYFNAKEYSQWPTIQKYLADMSLTFKECFRVLVPNRKFCLNISDLPEKGASGVRWIPLGSELLKTCLDIGFELVDRILWYKTPIKGFQYGSLPYPPSPLICDSMEYIYILRKPNGAKPDYSHLTQLQKEASKLTRAEYAEFTKQIWTMRRVRLKDNKDGHIAPFPDELPNRCIKLYSFVGETVLDPFGGSGTTTKMAILNKRNSILYEIKKEYLKYIKEKIGMNKLSKPLFDDIFSKAKVEIVYEK